MAGLAEIDTGYLLNAGVLGGTALVGFGIWMGTSDTGSHFLNKHGVELPDFFTYNSATPQHELLYGLDIEPAEKIRFQLYAPDVDESLCSPVAFGDIVDNANVETKVENLPSFRYLYAIEHDEISCVSPRFGDLAFLHTSNHTSSQKKFTLLHSVLSSIGNFIVPRSFGLSFLGYATGIFILAVLVLIPLAKAVQFVRKMQEAIEACHEATENVKKITSHLASASQNVEEVKQGLVLLRQDFRKFNNLEEKLDRCMPSLQNKVNAHDGHVNKLDKHIARLEKQIANVDDDLAILDNSVKGTRQKLSAKLSSYISYLRLVQEPLGTKRSGLNKDDLEGHLEAVLYAIQLELQMKTNDIANIRTGRGFQTSPLNRGYGSPMR